MSKPQDKETNSAVHLADMSALSLKVGLSAFPKNFFLNDIHEVLLEGHQQKTNSEDDPSKSKEDSRQRECHNTKRSKIPHGQATVFCVKTVDSSIVNPVSLVTGCLISPVIIDSNPFLRLMNYR